MVSDWTEFTRGARVELMLDSRPSEPLSENERAVEVLMREDPVRLVAAEKRGWLLKLCTSGRARIGEQS